VSIKEQLDAIKPGKNYPASVEVTETVDGEVHTIKWFLQSYVVGMYCAIYFPGSTLPCQTGDRNNKGFVAQLKKELVKALVRGAEIEIGTLRPVKTLEDEKTH
jgi:hypothetical protein